MREIKFRFFREKPSPKMIYPECDFLVNHLGTPMGIIRYPKNKIEVVELDVIPLQFTGLKDKNGKDIYEGDILSNGFNATGVMKFNNGMFVCDFVYNNKLPKYNQEKCTFRIYSINMTTSVVGNIHENPELL